MGRLTGRQAVCCIWCISVLQVIQHQRLLPCQEDELRIQRQRTLADVVRGDGRRAPQYARITKKGPLYNADEFRGMHTATFMGGPVCLFMGKPHLQLVAVELWSSRGRAFYCSSLS